MYTEFGEKLYWSIHNEIDLYIKFKAKKEDLYIETNCYPIFKIKY